MLKKSLVLILNNFFHITTIFFCFFIIFNFHCFFRFYYLNFVDIFWFSNFFLISYFNFGELTLKNILNKYFFFIFNFAIPYPFFLKNMKISSFHNLNHWFLHFFHYFQDFPLFIYVSLPFLKNYLYIKLLNQIKKKR